MTRGSMPDSWSRVAQVRRRSPELQTFDPGPLLGHPEGPLAGDNRSYESRLRILVVEKEGGPAAVLCDQPFDDELHLGTERDDVDFSCLVVLRTDGDGGGIEIHVGHTETENLFEPHGLEKRALDDRSKMQARGRHEPLFFLVRENAQPAVFLFLCEMEGAP